MSSINSISTAGEVGQPHSDQHRGQVNIAFEPSGSRRIAGPLVFKFLQYGGVGFFSVFILAALVVPWFNSQREISRRLTCMNNIRELGSALASYETSNRVYPGFREGLKVENSIQFGGVTTDTIPVHWVVPLLPNLKRPDLARKWKNATGVEVSDNGQITYTFSKGGRDAGSPLEYLDFLVCPSDPRSAQPAGQVQPMSYIANSGLQDVAATTKYAADWPANGVFVSRWEMPQGPDAEPLMMATNSADNVSRGDGVSTTLLLGESTQARNYDDVFVSVGGPGSLLKPVSEQWSCFVWQPEYPLPANLSQAKINGRPANGRDPSPSLAADITYARPSSNHPGGANFVYCDGHARFISESLDYMVFALLMTSDGSRATLPGMGLPVPAVFTTTPLDEGGCMHDHGPRTGQ